MIDKEQQAEIERFEAAFAQAERRNGRCAVQIAIDDHPAGKVIAARVADVDHLSAPQIAQVLRGLGVRVNGRAIGDGSIATHRAGTCICDRS